MTQEELENLIDTKKKIRHEFIEFAKKYNLKLNEKCMKNGSQAHFFVATNGSETHLTIGFHDVVCTKSLVACKDYAGGTDEAIKFLEEMYTDCIEKYKKLNTRRKYESGNEKL